MPARTTRSTRSTRPARPTGRRAAPIARPSSVPSGYSGTPLPKKLGIRPGMAVALLGAPEGFEATLGALPDGARATRSARARAGLSLWFVRSRRELAQGLARMVARAEGSGLWIAWPKKSSPLATDVGEADVRRLALAAGLVDFKVCALDADWSGLRFNRRAHGSHE